MIEATLRAEPNSHTPRRGSAWIASCTIDGITHTARSRSGALHALARILGANNIPDQPLSATDQVGRTIRYRSIHDMALWTYEESATQPLRRRRWEAYGAAARDVDAKNAQKTAGKGLIPDQGASLINEQDVPAQNRAAE